MLTGKGWDDVPPELRKQAESPWFASFLAVRSGAARRQARSADPGRSRARSTRRCRRTTPRSSARLANARKNAPKTEVVVVPGINHLLVPAKTGEVAEYPTLTDRTISPEVTSKIADWLKAH